MAPLKIRLLGPLKLYAGKEEIEIDVKGEAKLREVLKDLVKRESSLSRAIEQDGRVKPGYLIFINDADYMVFEGLETVVRNSYVITILPVSHGGADV